jgi:hypothetical protein
MKSSLAHPGSPLRRLVLRWGGCVLAVLVCLPLFTGCNKGPGAGKANVKGKVTLGGKGVGPNASVIFYGGEDKQVGEAITTGEGEYNMTDVPTGPVKIAVLRRGPATATKAMPMPGMKETAPEVPIPAKYSKPTDGLTYTVTSGSQKHDIELTP